MKFGHFVPICIPGTYQVTRFRRDIFHSSHSIENRSGGTRFPKDEGKSVRAKRNEQIEESRLKRDISSFQRPLTGRIVIITSASCFPASRGAEPLPLSAATLVQISRSSLRHPPDFIEFNQKQPLSFSLFSLVTRH